MMFTMMEIKMGNFKPNSIHDTLKERQNNPLLFRLLVGTYHTIL